MNCDRKRTYVIITMIFFVLFLSLLIPVSVRRIVVCGELVVLGLIVFYYIKKRSILSINKKQVAFLMLLIGLVYIMFYYLTGIEYGFYKNFYSTLKLRLLTHIIPIAGIIISIEIIRRIVLAQNLKIANILMFITGIIADMIIFINVSAIKSFGSFMDVVALTIFPTISFNILYTFLSKRYGATPNIIFRIIISVYLYILPVVPKTPDVLVSFAKLVVPIAIYLFIKVLYDKQKKVISHKAKKTSYLFTIVSVTIMISVVMLISCQFKYGLLVIGSESMTGEINKGDAIVYEQYDGQIISEGDVIVFNSNGSKIVHRVIDVERINNVNRYYTKGDANEDADFGYRTEADIIGIVHFKVLYIGYPTIWIRSVFD